MEIRRSRSLRRCVSIPRDRTLPRTEARSAGTKRFATAEIPDFQRASNDGNVVLGPQACVRPFLILVEDAAWRNRFHHLSGLLGSSPLPVMRRQGPSFERLGVLVDAVHEFSAAR